jgi:hypothetical protein
VKNIVEVLRQKEAALLQLQNEVEILRRAMSLLSEEGETASTVRPFAQTGTDARTKPAVAEMTSPRQFP